MAGEDETPTQDPRDKDVGDQMPEEQPEEAVVEDDAAEPEPEMGGSPPP